MAINVDNQGSIALAKNPGFHERTDMENGKFNNVPKVELISVVVRVETVRQRQTLVKEPTIERTTFVEIAEYKISGVREVVKEHR